MQRAYAEMCHEKKLVELVISSLNTCIAVEQGKKKAEAILRSTHSVNIQQKWKPLLEECHQHLRDNRSENSMEYIRESLLRKGTSDLHLAILSERWNTVRLKKSCKYEAVHVRKMKNPCPSFSTPSRTPVYKV